MMECLQAENLTTILEDDSLDNLLHDWIVCGTGLDPTLVRPAWQPDPPPIPDFLCPCWAAFYITKVETDWDPVVQNWSGMETPGPGVMGTSVYRNETIFMTITFYGRSAGATAVAMRMGAYVNRASLLPVTLVGFYGQTTVSEIIKGRWQRRVDLDIQLRRAVQLMYVNPDMAIESLCGTIVPEKPYQEIPFCFDENSTVTHKGDC